jgi:phosphoribosylamine---glycine ligase
VKILVVGSGAREHAIVRALALSSEVAAPHGAPPQRAEDPARPARTDHEVHAAPGNPGIAALATLHAVDPVDGAAVAALAAGLSADLVVVGPEAPLVAGVADAVRAAGIPCFGPSAEAAELEGSKAFAKEVMAAAGVPTAMAHVCTTLGEVAAALDAFGAPHVVKDDGLAAGKGVVVTDDRDAALEHAAACLGKPGGAVVVEEFLDGPEVSLFCLSDGTTVVPLAPAQDFKRALDGDEGPNTGGMGAYSPLTWAPEGLVDEVVARVAQPTVDEMRRRGTPFAGVLYCGLALTARGVRVIEFNARFGDPETQVVLARLATPLAEVLLAAAEGRLDSMPRLHWRDEAAVTVVVAAHGYPGSVRAGDPVEGVADAEAVPGVHVLHAGTATDDGALVSSGGRVLSVVGVGADVAAARAVAYDGVARISLRGSHHRRDIAARMPELPAPPGS